MSRAAVPALGVSVLLCAGAALAQPSAATSLLDVPYVAQTEALCGGAAAAMVLRYWGARDVNATDFAPLVRPGERGIRTSDLTEETRARGWTAVPATPAVDGGAGILRAHVDRGRPVIALIEDRPDVFHYVVIVAVAGPQVILHDPARRPFMTLDWADFDRRWAIADRWMLVVVPRDPNGMEPAVFGPRGTAASDRRSEDRRLQGATDTVEPATDNMEPAVFRPRDTGPCAQLIAASVARAREGEDGDAEQGLSAATRLCPRAAAAWRELAGLRFKERRWPEAADLAARAMRLAPDDEYAAELAGVSAFLAGDQAAALDAWNRLGQPRIDRIVIEGADRTHHPRIVDALGLRPRTLLTSGRLAQAERRFAQLPTASATKLRYQPRDDGMADVEAAMVEHDLLPRGWVGWGGVSASAIVAGDLRVDLSGASGRGEVWSAGYRWTTARPRISVAMAQPAPGALPGVLTIDGRWERQSYRLVDVAAGLQTGGRERGDRAAGVLLRETERRAGVELADWLTSNLRWRAAGSFHRFDRDGFAATEGGVDLRLLADRLSLQADGGVWWPTGARSRFGRFEADASWDSNPVESSAAHRWTAGSTYVAASSRAPLALWPGAGTGKGRAALLRAHPLLDDEGVIAGDVFGRRMVSATIEYERRTWRHPLAAAGVAAFVDVARAWDRRLDAGPSPLHIDVGGGVRLRSPALRGVVRLDVARGLRDGRGAVSIGYVVGVGGHRQSEIGNRRSGNHR